MSIEGWGRSPFDVKWLRDGTNRAKKKRQEMRVPSLPSKESKAEWHSSQNLSVTLLQRVSLGNDWAFVKTHKQCIIQRLALASPSRPAELMHLQPWPEEKLVQRAAETARAEHGPPAVCSPSFFYTFRCSLLPVFPIPSCGLGLQGTGTVPVHPTAGCRWLHHHLPAGSAQPSSDLGSCLSYQEPGQTRQTWTRLSGRG